MYTIYKSNQFDKWLSDLRDPIGKAQVLSRIRAAQTGNQQRDIEDAISMAKAMKD